MNRSQSQVHARTGIGFRPIGFGGAPIGNFNGAFTDDSAQSLIHHAWDLGVRYFDTAPGYGTGLSEYRLGYALRRYAGEDLTVSTKVGRVVSPTLNGPTVDGQYIDLPPFTAEFDYSYDGVMRGIEQSMQRMLTDRFDIVYIHDCDRYTHGTDQPSQFRTAIDGAYPALESLRDQGVVGAIGFGVNETDVMADAVKATDVDICLLAGRYTLLEQEPLDDLLPLCEQRGVGITLGGVYNSGILATGPTEGARFNYAPAPADVREKAAKLEEVCRDHDVPLAAAALQFAFAHPVVVNIIVGARTTDQQQRNADLFDTEIPTALWDELRSIGLIRPDAPTP